MSTDPANVADATQPPSPPAKSKTGRYIKLGFLAAILGVLAWNVYKIYYGPPPPVPYTENLPAALKQASTQGRKIVLIVYERFPGDAYKTTVSQTMAKPANIEAINRSNAIVVRTTADDPAVKPYDVQAAADRPAAAPGRQGGHSMGNRHRGGPFPPGIPERPARAL